jgi:hypothetical protein
MPSLTVTVRVQLALEGRGAASVNDVLDAAPLLNDPAHGAAATHA